MKLCIYSNCQGDGIAHFIRKVKPAWDIRVHHNWQLMMGEQSPEALLADLKDCDVFVYQPTDGFVCKGGYVMPTTGDMVTSLPSHVARISFPYVFNTGFFPIVKSGKWWTGSALVQAAVKGETNVVAGYDMNVWPFDCARRFAENLAEQSRREECCTLQFAPFILQNFQTKHMFLLHNHPASALFVEMARAVLREIGPALDVEIPHDGPNDANLPGYHGVHPAVVRELGLRYEPDRTGEDMDYYRVLIQEMASTKGVL